MKIIAKVIVLTFSALILLTLTASAQAPKTIVYQGRLTDISGEPITTAQSVTFSIYSVPTGGLVRWSETLTIQPDAEGLFTVELGTEDTTLHSVFSGDKRYLGLKVGDDDEMTPRQLLTSTPYAISAENIPDGSVTTGKLSDAAVTNRKIADDAVKSSNIEDNTITSADIGDEPGLAFVLSVPANATRPIPTGTNALDSITIAAPAAGWLYVWANVNVFVNHETGTLDQLLFQVSAAADTLIPNNYGLAMVKVPPELPTSNNYVYPIDCHRAFQVDEAGEYKFYFTAKTLTGAGSQDSFFNLQLTAMYFPTSYGAVSAVPSPTGKTEDTGKTGTNNKTKEGSD